MEGPFGRNDRMVFLLLFLSASAWASDRPIVIFFGGTHSTVEDMQKWRASARAQCGGSHQFHPVSYAAGKDFNEKAALAASDSLTTKLAAQIRQHPNWKIILACHSSGCASSKALAEKLLNHPGHANNILGMHSFEGFRPSDTLQKSVPAVCWSAQNPNVKSFQKKKKDGTFETVSATGPNWNSMSSCRNHQVLKNTRCHSQWCLHFSLVNANARDAAIGYDSEDFAANMAWLKGCRPPAREAPVSEEGNSQPAE